MHASTTDTHARRDSACRSSRASAAIGLIFSALVCGATSAYAQPTLNVIGAWGGSVNAVYIDPVSPNTAYVAAGRRLVVLNIADPANIVELGAMDLGAIVYDVKVRNGFAYCGCGSPSFLSVVNINNPAL